MSDPFFGSDLFGELDRMQRQMASLFGGFPSGLRSGRLGAFLPINAFRRVVDLPWWRNKQDGHPGHHHSDQVRAHTTRRPS